MAVRKTRQFWAQQIAAARSSGMSKAAFCRERGLDYRTFYRWSRRLGVAEVTLAPAQAMVPIALRTSLPVAAPTAMTLRVGAVVSLSIPASVDAGWLATLLREAAAC